MRPICISHLAPRSSAADDNNFPTDHRSDGLRDIGWRIVRKGWQKCQGPAKCDVRHHLHEAGDVAVARVPIGLHRLKLVDSAFGWAAYLHRRTHQYSGTGCSLQPAPVGLNSLLPTSRAAHTFALQPGGVTCACAHYDLRRKQSCRGL